MDEMAAARFNFYWYLSFLVPAILMAAATYSHKKAILWPGVLASLVATYLLCNAAVQTKWKTRYEMAQTQAEMDYASNDGANLVFTAMITAPFESVMYTSIWGVVGWRMWPRLMGKNET